MDEMEGFFIMPKGRMLNKKISFDEEVARLSPKSVILYTWCIPNLDVEGRILADLHFLKGQVVPYLKFFNTKTIKKCIEEITNTNLVALYGNEHKYMQFVGFTKNQKLNREREAPSEISAPTQEELKSNSRVTPAKVKLKEVKSSEVNNTTQIKNLLDLFLPNTQQTI